MSLVIEGTMRDADKVAGTMQALRGAGYEIDARVLAVNEQFSQQGILQRYEGQKADRGTGRMTTAQAHQAAYDGMPVTVERIERDKLADRVTVYRRGAEAIYHNELQAEAWTKEPQARAASEAERSRPMTLHELRSYAEGFDRLAELLARPGRQASAEEVGNVEGLRWQAKSELGAAEALQQQRNDQAARALLSQPPAQAVQEHPRLAGAFATISAYDTALRAQGIEQEQRDQGVEQMRQALAREVMAGRYPAIKTEQLRFVNAPERNGGPEQDRPELGQ